MQLPNSISKKFLTLPTWDRETPPTCGLSETVIFFYPSSVGLNNLLYCGWWRMAIFPIARALVKILVPRRQLRNHSSQMCWKTFVSTIRWYFFRCSFRPLSLMNRPKIYEISDKCFLGLSGLGTRFPRKDIRRVHRHEVSFFGGGGFGLAPLLPPPASTSPSTFPKPKVSSDPFGSTHRRKSFRTALFFWTFFLSLRDPPFELALRKPWLAMLTPLAWLQSNPLPSPNDTSGCRAFWMRFCLCFPAVFLTLYFYPGTWNYRRCAMLTNPIFPSPYFTERFLSF